MTLHDLRDAYILSHDAISAAAAAAHHLKAFHLHSNSNSNPHVAPKSRQPAHQRHYLPAHHVRHYHPSVQTSSSSCSTCGISSSSSSSSSSSRNSATAPVLPPLPIPSHALGHSVQPGLKYDHPLLPATLPASPYAAAPTPVFIGTMTKEVFISICTGYLDSTMALNHGKALPVHSHPESVFFSVSKPEISTDEYVRRLVNFTQCSPAAFIVMLVYLERIAQANHRLRITPFNLHRLLVTALMLSCKCLEDQCYSTLHYAKVGGIPTAREMNRLELQYLRYVNFRMHVPVEIFFTKQHELNSLAMQTM